MNGRIFISISIKISIKIVGLDKCEESYYLLLASDYMLESERHSIVWFLIKIC